MAPFSVFTYESGRVVVTGCLCVAVSLQDWVGLNNLILQSTSFLLCVEPRRGGKKRDKNTEVGGEKGCEGT